MTPFRGSPEQPPASTKPERLNVRLETADDRAAALDVEREAFGGPLEARIVEEVRDVPGSFALVAELDGVIVGHVQISPAFIGADAVSALGPIGVSVAHRRHGIGTALIDAALAEARRQGAMAVILLGSPRFYGAVGFLPAADFGLANPYTGMQEEGFVVKEEDFQIAVLDQERVGRLRGPVRWHPAFG